MRIGPLREPWTVRCARRSQRLTAIGQFSSAYSLYQNLTSVQRRHHHGTNWSIVCFRPAAQPLPARVCFGSRVFRPARINIQMDSIRTIRSTVPFSFDPDVPAGV